MSCFTSKTNSPQFDFDPNNPTSRKMSTDPSRRNTAPGTRRNSEFAPGTRRNSEFQPDTRRNSEFSPGTRRNSEFPPGTRRNSGQRGQSPVALDGDGDLPWPDYDYDEPQDNVNEYECKVICCEDDPEDMDAIDDVDVDVDVDIQEKYESQIKLYRLVVIVMIGALCIGTVMIMAAGKVSPGCKLENGQPCDAHMKKNVMPKTSCVNGGGVNNPGVKCQGQPMNFNKPPPCPQQANSRCTKPGP